MARRLTTAQKQMALRLRAHGWSLAEIARQIGCHATLVGLMLLRQYMPKGTDLATFTPLDLQRIQDSLNGRPRMTLGYRTPAENMLELLR
jgi:IS30 family transposase